MLGVDTRKPASIVEPAYNDSRGVTAKFNKNMLKHLNDRLGTSFRLDLFDHKVKYVEDAGCLEMHLVCLREHEVKIGEETFHFGQSESICTERSYKYSRDEVEDLADSAGFVVDQTWTDAEQKFMVALMRVKS